MNAVMREGELHIPKVASFASRLVEARHSAQLSQTDLERSSGVPKTRLSRYENGHILPSLQTLKKIADALGVTEASLLGERTAPEDEFLRSLRSRGVEVRTVAEAARLAAYLAEALASDEVKIRRRATKR